MPDNDTTRPLPPNRGSFYSVRVRGDGDHEWFEEPPQDGEYGEVRYDEGNLASARRFAKFLGGWVVEVGERTVYDAAAGDGVVPYDPDDPGVEQDNNDGNPGDWGNVPFGVYAAEVDDILRTHGNPETTQKEFDEAAAAQKEGWAPGEFVHHTLRARQNAGLLDHGDGR